MKERDWNLLIWALEQRKCILLLGDEASGAPGRTLREELAAELRSDLPDVAGDGLDLPQITWLYESENSRRDLLNRVVEFYAKRPAEPFPIHRRLAELPFHCILTSCHDTSMSSALAAAGVGDPGQAARPDQPTTKRPRPACYDFRGPSEQLDGVGTATAPLVYHLFGASARPDSLVLTEQDLVDLLVAVVSKTPAIPDLLRAELRDPKKMFLFLGFGVRNWYTRVFLHVLKVQSGDSRSFALEQFPTTADLGRSVFYYRHGYKVEVFNQCEDQFVEDLCDRFAQSASARPSPGPRSAAVAVPAVTAGPRPTVFICHVHENAGLARRVAQRFVDDGLEPWLDQSDLEPGAVWDNEIRRRIAEVDYFVVLVTTELAARDESFAFTEISLAVTRATSIRHRRFIIPVRVNGGPMLDELSQFHQDIPAESGATAGLADLVTDDTEAQSIGAIASSIKRDVERRAKKGR